MGRKLRIGRGPELPALPSAHKYRFCATSDVLALQGASALAEIYKNGKTGSNMLIIRERPIKTPPRASGVAHCPTIHLQGRGHRIDKNCHFCVTVTCPGKQLPKGTHESLSAGSAQGIGSGRREVVSCLSE